MLFRNSTQIADVCRALCALAGRHDLWTGDGPTDKALRWRGGEHPLQMSERVLFEIAWALWRGMGTVDFADIVYGLDGASLKAVGSLLLAVSVNNPDHVDAWLDAYAAPFVRPIRGPS